MLLPKARALSRYDAGTAAGRLRTIDRVFNLLADPIK